MRHALIAMLALALLAPQIANAQTRELPFGEIQVSDLPGQDVLRLRKCEGTWNEPVTRLGIDVRNADVYLYDVAVRDEKGEVRLVQVRDTFRRNWPTRWIDLGDPICVTYLELKPDPDIPRRPPAAQPVITLRGQIAAPEPTPVPPSG